MIFFFIAAFQLSALDFTVQVTPSVSVPLGPVIIGGDGKSTPVYTVGGGAQVGLSTEFFNFLTVSPELAYGIKPLKGDNSSPIAQFYDLGLGIGAYWMPLSRLRINGIGSAGVYGIAGETDTGGFYNVFWKARVGAGFRMSPTMTLSATAGFEDFRVMDGSLYNGFAFGVSLTISLDFSSAKDDIRMSFVQDEAVYPLVSGLYKENQVGTLSIFNNEQAEIRNVEISFQVPGYTNSAMSCGTMGLINKQDTVEFPLLADFSEEIYKFTENGKMSGEVIINYEMLGVMRRLVKAQTIQVYNRNAVRWTDPAMLAAYASANAIEVLDYSKFAVGLARSRLRTGLNQPMQFGMYLFEGLRIGGMTRSEDPATPYVATHLDANLLDYIQYPFQTLSFSTGDCDDLGLLYAATLQSVGIKASYLPIGKDFLVALCLGIAPSDADKFFDQDVNYFEYAGEIWIPLSMATLREGFVNSWYAALDALDELEASGEIPVWIALGEAWQLYPAVGIAGEGSSFKKPAEDALIRAVENGLVRYISAEFGPKIRAIRGNIAAMGSSASLYNQLGLLYVRAGMYLEAKTEFLNGAGLGSVASYVNLGNITLLQKDLPNAKVYYAKALALQPDNKSAKSGLDRVLSELDE